MSGKVVYGVSDAWVGGGSVFVRRGETWDADDPVVAQNPAAFTDDPDSAGLVRRSAPRGAEQVEQVEQATAAPGERRSVRPRPARDEPQA